MHDKSTPSLVLSSTDEGIQHGDELHDEDCPCPLCRLYRWRMDTHSDAGTVPVCEGDDCQGCADCPDVPLSTIFTRFGAANGATSGVQPDDLAKHTSLCLDRSWTVYKQSALDQHICICDGRGDGMDWDELDRERRLVGQQEVEVRQERITREREKWQTQDTPADFTAGTTLDDLTAVFDDDVDLSPTPGILDRRHGDGGLVLPAGKLNWLYGLPAGGKSFVGAIGVSEAVLRGGRVMFLDYEDNKKTFQQRAAILGLNPKDHTDSFRYIHGGLADSPLATAQAQDWLSQADDTEMSLVVIDAAESSGCPSDGASVNEWLAKVVQPWERLGITIIVIDHIPKQREGRPDGPIGSQRKLAAVTGIALKVTGNCWSKTKNGRLVLTCEKDRTGNYAKGEKVAAIVGEWDSAGHSRSFGYRIVNPSQGDDDTGNIGGAILEYVAEAMPEGINSQRAIIANVKGKRDTIISTIDNLVEGGLLELAQRGKGKGNNYTITGNGLEVIS